MERTLHAQRKKLHLHNYNKRLEHLRSEFDKLKESYGRRQDHCYRHNTMDQSHTFSEHSVLSKKLEELNTKCEQWENQRLDQQKDIAALEVHQKSLAFKVQVFQASGGHLPPQEVPVVVDRTETQWQESEVTSLQTQLDQALEEAYNNEVKGQQLREETESKRRRSQEEIQRLLLEIEMNCTEQQKSVEELDNLTSDLWTTEDLIHARQRMGERRGQSGVSRLQEQLLAQENALRLEAYHSAAPPLQESLVKEELQCLEHAGKFKDNAIATKTPSHEGRLHGTTEFTKEGEQLAKREHAWEVLRTIAHPSWEQTGTRNHPEKKPPRLHGNRDRAKEITAEANGSWTLCHAFSHQEMAQLQCSESTPGELFLQEEERRLRELENCFYSHIQQLNWDTSRTIELHSAT